MRSAEQDRVERRLVQVADLEVPQAQQVADARRGEDEPAHLSGPQGDRVARKVRSGQPGPAVLVDPAAERRRRGSARGAGCSRSRARAAASSARAAGELVPGLHGQPEVVLVRLVEVDVSGDLDRPGQAIGRDHASASLTNRSGRVVWNLS